MTTLIAVYNSDGYVGRCDARCYNATGPHCDCICHGANHGAGLVAAANNTRQMAERWIEQYTAEYKTELGKYPMWRVLGDEPAPAAQMALPLPLVGA